MDQGELLVISNALKVRPTLAMLLKVEEKSGCQNLPKVNHAILEVDQSG